MGTESGIVPAAATLAAQGDSKPSDVRYHRRCGTKPKNRSAAATEGKATGVTAVVRQTGFVGKCPDMEGHIYDCTNSRQSNMYTRTSNEIAEYVGMNYRNGGDVRLTVEMLKIPTLAMPKAAVAGTDGKVDSMAKLISEKMVNEYVRQVTTLNLNICTLYSLVWGQCTDTMRQRVEALKDFSVVHAELDGLELLSWHRQGGTIIAIYDPTSG
eukprot:scaffold26100_cov31-Attheya_sp.AAC.7